MYESHGFGVTQNRETSSVFEIFGILVYVLYCASNITTPFPVFLSAIQTLAHSWLSGLIAILGLGAIKLIESLNPFEITFQASGAVKLKSFFIKGSFCNVES